MDAGRLHAHMLGQVAITETVAAARADQLSAWASNWSRVFAEEAAGDLAEVGVSMAEYYLLIDRFVIVVNATRSI